MLRLADISDPSVTELEGLSLTLPLAPMWQTSVSIPIQEPPPLAAPAVDTRTKWACVVRLGGIGDDIMASSILPLLAKEHKIEFIAQRPWAAVLENNPYIDKLTVKDSKDFPNGGGNEWFNWFASRAKEYDYFVNLSHTCETTLACVAAQSAFYWNDTYRRKYCGKNYLEYIHDVANLPYEFNPRFYPTEEEVKKAQVTKERVMRAMGASRVIGWCISGTRIDKAYPYSPMVIARIIKELRLPVILFGAGKDAEAAEVVGNQVVIQNGSGEGLHFAIEADYHKSSPELRAKLGLVPDVTNWPVRRGLAQVQLCDLVIGPDTGFMWGVAMEKMPKIVMLSHASQENITKHWHNTITLHADQKRVPCWPCHKLHDGLDTCVPNKDNNGAACISDISVEEILRKAKVSLNSIQET